MGPGFAAGLQDFKANSFERRETVLILLFVSFFSKLACILRQDLVGDCMTACWMARPFLCKVLRGLPVFSCDYKLRAT